MAYVRVRRDSGARDGNTDEQISWRSVRCQTETECDETRRRRKGERKPRERESERETERELKRWVEKKYKL